MSFAHSFISELRKHTSLVVSLLMKRCRQRYSELMVICGCILILNVLGIFIYTNQKSL